MRYTDASLIDRLHREAKAAGTITKLADRYGVSVQYLSEVIRGRKEAGPKILTALGLVREIRYVAKVSA